MGEFDHRVQAGCCANSDCLRDTYQDGKRNCHGDGDLDRDAVDHANYQCDGHRDGNSNCDRNSNCDGNRNFDRNRH